MSSKCLRSFIPVHHMDAQKMMAIFKKRERDKLWIMRVGLCVTLIFSVNLCLLFYGGGTSPKPCFSGEKSACTALLGSSGGGTSFSRWKMPPPSMYWFRISSTSPRLSLSHDPFMKPSCFLSPGSKSEPSLFLSLFLVSFGCESFGFRKGFTSHFHVSVRPTPFWQRRIDVSFCV